MAMGVQIYLIINMNYDQNVFEYFILIERFEESEISDLLSKHHIYL